MKRPMSKKASERAHAKRRALERFGLTLTSADLDEAAAACRAQGKTDHPMNPKFLCAQSFRVMVYELTVKGVRVQAAYDRRRRAIITFLPPSHRPQTKQELAAQRDARASQPWRGL